MDKLRNLFESYTGQKVSDTEELNSSGSNRRYFRLKGGNISIIGVIGTSREENNAFISLSAHFLSKGIKVPKVLAVSEDGMRYIQEDLGDDQLYKVVSQGRESGEYSSLRVPSSVPCHGDAAETSVQGSRGAGLVSLLSGAGFQRADDPLRSELFQILLPESYRTGVQRGEASGRFREAKDGPDAGYGRDTFMYRDFQARNVMMKDGEPYFIDFQGGRRGPIYYDVASFVWQARSRYPENLRKEMVQTYLRALKGYMDVDEAHFNERLRLFILFRTLQVLGAYGFRGYFEKKPHFLASVPYALGNLRRLLQKPFEDYPYLNEILTKLTTMSQFNNIAEDKRLEVRVFSFAYKKGIPVDTSGNGGGYVFDCRAINNPGKYEHYRQFTGLDKEVIKFLEDDGGITKFLNNVYDLVDNHVKCFIERKFTHLQVCFGCTGGQHRSVYCAEHLAQHLADRFDIKITVTHRELDIEKIL